MTTSVASAAGAVTRAGFERMVAEVCLGKVGAVAAREVSRFARNSRDWQQLIEMCRVVDSLLVDQEAVYAPRQGNDRLLLGLKGSLNEYELDLLRQRSLAARYEKARRGELSVAAPVGYVKTDWLDNGEPRCIAFGGLRVDDAIEEQLLRVLEPGAIEAALEADQEEAHRRDEVLEALRRDLEAARYAADKAFRQYDATDPVNRLVPAELELRWNRALERVTELEGRIQKHASEASTTTPTSPDQFATLAHQSSGNHAS
jgi:Resolvase, N terminal domain